MSAPANRNAANDREGARGSDVASARQVVDESNARRAEAASSRTSAACVSDGDALTFGECEGMCGRSVTFVGWDRYCDECEAEMREEDEAARERLREEDEYLYGV